MNFKLPKVSSLPDEIYRRKSFFRDASVGVAFVAAISILLLVAGYVINRLSSGRAYQEKWKEYNDCGLA